MYAIVNGKLHWILAIDWFGGTNRRESGRFTTQWHQINCTGHPEDASTATLTTNLTATKQMLKLMFTTSNHHSIFVISTKTSKLIWPGCSSCQMMLFHVTSLIPRIRDGESFPTLVYSNRPLKLMQGMTVLSLSFDINMNLSHNIALTLTSMFLSFVSLIRSLKQTQFWVQAMVERYQNKGRLVSSLLMIKVIDTLYAGDSNRVTTRNHSAQKFARRLQRCDSYDFIANITMQSPGRRKQSRLTSKLLTTAKVWRRK